MFFVALNEFDQGGFLWERARRVLGRPLQWSTANSWWKVALKRKRLAFSNFIILQYGIHFLSHFVVETSDMPVIIIKWRASHSALAPLFDCILHGI